MAPSASTPEEGELLDVGRIIKPHGLTGEVVVDLFTDQTSRLDPGTVLSGPGGEALVVEASRPHQSRYLVFFEGVTDRPGADALRGQVLSAPPAVVPGALWVHELVGSELLATDGRVLGQIEAVEANPASDLMVLAGGGLVPLHFVVSHEPGVSVTVDIPDGLLD